MIYLLGVITLTLAFGFFLVFWYLSRRSPQTARLMEVMTETRTVEAAPRPTGWLRQVDADRLAGLLGPVLWLVGPRQNPELTRRLGSAGYRKQAHADLFYAAKLLLPLVSIVVIGFLVRENLFFWIIAGAAVGYLAPDFWLSYMMSKRRDIIRRSLPDALDLIMICLEAGLGLDQALVRVGQDLKISHPELSDELTLVQLEQRAGKPRVEAWRNLADRTGEDSVRSFVHMLIQTERFGTPLSKTLGVFAEAMRVKRRQKAEEMARKATIKLVPPLVFFIFPSLFIVILGPAMLAILHNLFKMFD